MRILLPLLLFAATAFAQTPVVSVADLDSAAFEESQGGLAKSITRLKNGVRDVIWTTDGKIDWPGVEFGQDKKPGPRHLRIGFTREIAVGSVLVRGGGTLSVLKAGAAYPGNLEDDAQWIPAERPTAREAEREDYALWVLPPGTKTRALRFSHVASPVESNPAGWLGGVYVLADRYANLAPQATVSSSSRAEAAELITDEAHNRTWKTWDNGEKGAAQAISPERPETVTLVWPKAVKLSSLGLLWSGFGAGEVQIFTGSAEENPLDSGNWKAVTSAKDIPVWYPHGLGVNWLSGDFAESRAVRLRMTAAAKAGHPHLVSKVAEGNRVWLGELLALSPLGDRPLASALVAPMAAEVPPPIPIKFKLPEAGLVTLVIEDKDGKRVRNLVSETPFPAGENTAYWDGSDDLLRDIDAAKHGLYHIPSRFVEPGAYTVRGLWRKPVSLKYEMSVYNAGTPPWPTADHTGGWMTNHTPPTSLAFVPASKTGTEPLMFIGAYVAEGGDGLQWVREDGTKIGGQGWVGGTWTGAPFLAADAGEKAFPEDLCYVGSMWEGELRLTAKTRTFQDRPVLKMKLGDDPRPKEGTNMVPVLEGFEGGDRQFVLAGVAVHDGMLVCSLTRQNKLMFVHAGTGKVLWEETVSNPRGMAFNKKGHLLVLSGNKLLTFICSPVLYGRIHPSGENGRTEFNHALVLEADTAISTGLEDPRHVVLDSEGRFYVSDRGKSHQVKRFSAAGKLEASVGKPGEPATGAYDPNHLNNPNGVALDSRGRIWVAEADFHPKRVSVWSPEGKLERAFYGPGEYGGGGVLDSKEKSRFFYKGQEFALDWKTGKDRLTRVFYRPEKLMEAHYGHYSPDTPLYPEAQGGQRYFTSCYTHNPTGGSGATFIWKDTGTEAKLVAACGTLHWWKALLEESFRACWPEKFDPIGAQHKNPAFFLWSDASGDGVPQVEEVKVIPVESGGVTVMNDLSFVVSRLGDDAVRFAPTGYSKAGVPSYDITQPEKLAVGSQKPASSGGDQGLRHADGWTVLTNAPQPYSNYGIGGVFKGEPRWTYPSPWPGLHASHEAASPDRPGMVVGHTRLLGGWVNPPGEGGPMFCVNGNMGNMYLFTADGLFVSTFFHDIRQRPNWAMPTAERGMDVSEVSLHDENFWPSITQTADGKVYLVDGARTSLVRVDGLDTIRRIPATRLELTEADLGKARDWFAHRETARQQSQLKQPLAISLSAPAPVVDGKLEDWTSADWATIDRRGTAANFNSNSRPYDVTAAVRVSGDRLYAAFRTTEKDLLQNSGETPEALFKTGGCLDLMLGTDGAQPADRSAAEAGDLRLLVTQVKKETRAVIYRAKVPGTKEPVSFSSPWRTIKIDVVQDVSAEVKLASDGAGLFEFSVPLNVLGWKPETGKRYRGDLGILRGNGFQTLQRVYWSNKATAITSDVPSEAELTPKLWGWWIPK